MTGKEEMKERNPRGSQKGMGITPRRIEGNVPCFYLVACMDVAAVTTGIGYTSVGVHVGQYFTNEIPVGMPPKNKHF